MCSCWNISRHYHVVGFGGMSLLRTRFTCGPKSPAKYLMIETRREVGSTRQQSLGLDDHNADTPATTYLCKARPCQTIIVVVLFKRHPLSLRQQENATADNIPTEAFNNHREHLPSKRKTTCTVVSQRRGWNNSRFPVVLTTRGLLPLATAAAAAAAPGFCTALLPFVQR